MLRLDGLTSDSERRKGSQCINSPTLFTEGPSPVTVIRGSAATAQITFRTFAGASASLEVPAEISLSSRVPTVTCLLTPA